MAAILIVTTTVKDQVAYQEYVQNVGPTLAPFEGKAIIRGKVDWLFSGELNHDSVGVIQFPDLAAIKSWHASEAYQALIALRNRAAEMTIIAYAVPE